MGFKLRGRTGRTGLGSCQVLPPLLQPCENLVSLQNTKNHRGPNRSYSWRVEVAMELAWAAVPRDMVSTKLQKSSVLRLHKTRGKPGESMAPLLWSPD